MNSVSAAKRSKPRWTGLVKVVIFLLAELLLIHVSRHVFGFECHRERYGFCTMARNLLLVVYSLSAAFVLLGLFARDAWRDLLSDANLRAMPLGLSLSGLIILIVSLPLLSLDLSGAGQAGIYLLWAIFGSMTAAGALLMIAPPARWRTFFQVLGWRIPAVALAGTAAPFIALQMRPFWQIEVLSDLTFKIVVWLLAAWGQTVVTVPQDKVIGSGDFFINIAPSCSGIEGLVLTTVFALIYLALFRRDLRFPHALIILPVALLASWLLNSLRIAVLVQIGISGHPELAVGGFHSHAGWLMFTLLSLGIVVATQYIGIFRLNPIQAVPETEAPPFFSDPIVAQILPFIVFMASALLASTFNDTPAVVYPLRVLAMAMVLALVWPHLRALPWRLDPLAIGAGVFIAIYWIALGPAGPGEPPIGEAGALLFGFWLVTRVVGTALFVPVIEELFFRGYLIDRIAPEDAPKRNVVIAVVISTAAFAALHDRWIAAAVAGVIFALLVLRSRNVTDAIIAHAAANALIAAWAIGTGNWAVI